ncbi:MAG TPA: hypothetical protein VN782_12280 [Usitatibacter sp.]|nr:hypothetical protein [Usitatibacter sp.]
MKIATRKPPVRTLPRNVRAVKPQSVQDHDLPILASEEAPAVHVDWEVLMTDGVQPALLIDGERRSRGRR